MLCYFYDYLNLLFLFPGYSTNPRPAFEPVKLHFAINNGDYVAAKREVARNIDLNYTVHGNTPVILSIIKEHYNIAELLVKAGADVIKPEKTKLERQPLHVSCKMGAPLEIVRLLVEYGAIVWGCDNDNNTPLNVAAYEGHIEIVKYLCDSGAHINAKDGRGKTPLFNAVENNHIELVKYLISQGATVNTHDVLGWTPLIQCVVCGYVELAKCLIYNGANINDRDRYGETALHFACARLTSYHMNCLCRANIDYYTRHLEMVTPVLRKALQSSVMESELVQLLVNAGSDINVLNGFGQSPLFISASEGNSQVVQYLINAGVDINLEEWIAEEQWPHKLDKSLCEILSNLFTLKVRSLQELSKYTIRKFLGKFPVDISESIIALPLPERLKNYLNVCM